MSSHSQNRAVYLHEDGSLHCITKRSCAQVPFEFSVSLLELYANLQLALDCVPVFGGVPIPVAKAILCNIEPVQAALDMAVRGAADKADD